VLTGFVQIFAELFGICAARYTETRCIEGRRHGGVADTPLQSFFEGRVRPGKMKWDA
jgi:hypothetical protein